MPTEMLATDWIQAISALFAALGIVFGVLKWGWVQQWDNAIEYVGATAVNERKMGYFVVRWWSWNVWSRRTISLPHLPTISTIIKAGDIGWFTSSMIDWAPQGNEEVSWRALYEAFFKELAWRQLARNKEYPEPIRQALSLAHDSVRSIEKTKGTSKFTDRHLLDFGISARQYLRKCVLDLPTIEGCKAQPASDPFLGYKKNWEGDLREIWIWKDRPSIQVSRLELIALSFIFGMPLCLQKDHRSGYFVSLYGEGIYGTCIYGEIGRPTEPWKLHLVHWRRDNPDQDPSKGSGFATSYATCMSCGCLPFGQSIGVTHVVHVTKKTLDGIKSGHLIGDFIPAAGDLSDGERMATRSCLSILPSATRKNYYRSYDSSHGDSGDIYDNVPNKVSKWPVVVARIVFGGLVPMATLNLVKAVRFTAQGYQELSEHGIGSVFSMLRELVFRVQDKTEEIRLFGPYIEDMARIERKVQITFGDPSKMNMRSATAMFARYMTMLEYYSAISAPTPGKGKKETAVFDACCDELRQSYTDALAEHQPSDLRINERNTVEYQINEILNSEVITAKVCGQIARYIILAWTYYVSIVVWDADELRESRKFLKKADKSRIYNISDTKSDIRNLPVSSVLS